jgi:hypothetical protein
MESNMRYGSIGTISHGTLRTVDLIEAFSEELEDLTRADDRYPCANANPANALIDRCGAWLDEDSDYCDEGTREPSEDHEDVGAELVQELSDALQDYAAPYCYFGTTEGDGSDFGFWPSMDSLEEDAQSGEVLKCAAGDEESALAESAGLYQNGGYIMSVTDHGNVSLLSIVPGIPPKVGTEVWSVV